MQQRQSSECAAFEGSRCLASGELHQVAREVKGFLDSNQNVSVLIFDAETGKPVELDFRGTEAEVLARLEPATPDAAPAEAPAPAKRGPGRPKLGVVSREVTLLPRHWDWLNAQPGGASVTLRKLVEQAKKANQGREAVRRAQEAAYGFMSAMAGDLPGFEESTRALFAGDAGRFNELTEPWPQGVREFARKLAAPAFPAAQ
ncbi:MAG: DUF2239 family protein [Desulfarculaceae bacterium]|nr:DUF2239 family protein [Desulfarculaceae bacterium]